MRETVLTQLSVGGLCHFADGMLNHCAFLRRFPQFPERTLPGRILLEMTGRGGVRFSVLIEFCVGRLGDFVDGMRQHGPFLFKGASLLAGALFQVTGRRSVGLAVLNELGVWGLRDFVDGVR